MTGAALRRTFDRLRLADEGPFTLVPDRLARVVAGTLTVVLLGIFVAGTILWLPALAANGKIGVEWNSDFVFYRQVAEHWLETGSLYLPYQLAGPWHLVIQESVLYPPTALLLFVPFALGLPPVVWWLIPLGLLAYALWRWRPGGWPLVGLLLIACWPRTVGSVVSGNTDMWTAAAVAAGLLWGWPAVLVSLKPTPWFLPFALIGIRRRGWWIAAGLVALISIPMLPLWAQYIAVVRNGDVPLAYSLPNLPIVVAPLVAYVGRRTSSD